MLRITSILFACLFFTLPAQAKHRIHHAHHHAVAVACVEVGSVMFPSCQNNNPFSGAREIRVTMHRERHARVRIAPVLLPAPRPMLDRPHIAETMIVAHPSGCPRIAFCGCGAALRVFGHHVRELWLAANWFKFPRSAPAPGAVAVRQHHVFVLQADLGGGVWEVYDANSGGHATRIHARSLAGYTIVNPHA